MSGIRVAMIDVDREGGMSDRESSATAPAITDPVR